MRALIYAAQYVAGHAHMPCRAARNALGACAPVRRMLGQTRASVEQGQCPAPPRTVVDERGNNRVQG
jgi:hypothetical protein